MVKYAGFWIRFLAAIIDTIFSLLLFGWLGTLINIFLVGQYGFSIGKKILGLKVINAKRFTHRFFVGKGQGGIGIVNALIRETIGKFVSGIILCIGFLMIGFNDKKQGLHDRIAKTYVVYA